MHSTISCPCMQAQLWVSSAHYVAAACVCTPFDQSASTYSSAMYCIASIYVYSICVCVRS